MNAVELPAPTASPRLTTVPAPPSNLRPHQKAAYKRIFEHLERDNTTQMCVLPTGAGKTYLAVAIAQAFNRVLFVVPRQELLHQAKQSYANLYDPNKVGTIWQDQFDHADKHFTVAMVQSLGRHFKQNTIDPYSKDLVILDEAHHSAAREWRQVAEYFHPRLLLGLSATPERLDGLPLNDIFSVISYSMDIRDAVKQGILVPPIAVQIETNEDLGNLPTGNSAKEQAELQRAVNTRRRNKIILNSYLQYGQNRKTIGFTAGVKHAEALAKLFNKHGIPSISVAGAHKDRAERISKFENGHYQVIFNDALLSEGYDHPPVEAVMMCRPTQSRALYTQCVGRGLRLSPETGKQDCLIMDFHDTSARMRLVGIWDFWGNKRKPRNRNRLRKPLNLFEHDEDDAAQHAEIAQNWNLETYLTHIDVLQPPPEIDEFVLGRHQWHFSPASDKQLQKLAQLGYDITLDWTKGQASSVISQEPATDNQLKLLLALGYDVIDYKWTKPAASKAINQAREEGKKPDWKLYASFQRKD